MNLSLLDSFGPALLGLLAALAVWAVRARFRSSRPVVPGGVRGWTLAGVLLGVGIVLLQRALYLPGAPLMRAVAGPVEHWFVIFTTPLVAGLAAVALLALPVVRRSGAGSADLARRTLTSFGARWWFVTLAALVAVMTLVTVMAGSVSSPDEQGRYTRYLVDVGPAGIWTSIYGWHYSVPCLVLTALLVSTALIGIQLAARPPMTPDRENDVANRRWRTRNIMAVTSGALLLHLAAVLRSLAGAAFTHGGVSTEQGWFRIGSTFAALEQPLWVAETIAELVGWLLWFTVLLAAVTALRSQTASQSRTRPRA
ncbi:hypothetical protein GCM10023169_07590 [Georgenia halophila]|uniref:Cytochrome c oxidase assembly protein n=1 Tax=Georgenia halophila TaxID=620889 RepID=A0ABP8KWR5_9MICO